MSRRTSAPGGKGNTVRIAAQSIRIPIRFGALKPFFVVTGLTPSRCYVEIGLDVVHVRMGWSFRADITPASIRSAHRVHEKRWSIGVHGRRGHWLVNGARGPLVAIDIDPPARARVLGLRVRLQELILSVEEPEALIDALSSR